MASKVVMAQLQENWGTVICLDASAEGSSSLDASGKIMSMDS